MKETTIKLACDWQGCKDTLLWVQEEPKSIPATLKDWFTIVIGNNVLSLSSYECGIMLLNHLADEKKKLVPFVVPSQVDPNQINLFESEGNPPQEAS